MADLLQKYRLLKGLCTGERAFTGPFYVTLDITRRCNLRCLGCRFHSAEANVPFLGDQDVKDFPFDWTEKLFSEFKKLNTRTLFLMGDGEPFLHPRIFDIIRLAKKFGLHTTVTTNGTLVDDTIARRIIDAGLDAIHISLWASSLEAYAKQYPGTDPVNFQRVINGIRILSSLKPRKLSRIPYIVLTSPLNRFNYQSVDEMAALAKDAGCDAISFTPFKTNRGKLSHYTLSGEEQENLCNHMIRFKDQMRAYSLADNIDRLLLRYRFSDIGQRLPCYICWFHSRIKVDGTVLSCGRSELVLGSLKTESFSEIWNGKAYRLQRRKALSPDGVAYRNEICDCEFCSFVQDNVSIHKISKYFLPFLSSFKEDAEERP
jgi:MoaA/NifB/PqqE/SkfB family radical SAM enzyme